jgi:spore coat polysaccharide biosynthesis protein SpsF
MTGVFLQVRLESSRLARKALLPLGDRSVIEHAMRALRGVPAEHYALLTDQESAAALEDPASAYGFALHIGDPSDVLSRYAGAARRFEVDTIVRATGDNPLVSAALASETVALLRRNGADYATYTGVPVGTGVEVVRAESLLRADAEAAAPYEREHVTPYLYRHPERFRLAEEPAGPERTAPEIRVTVDTAEDYARLGRVFSALYQGRPIELDELLAWFRGFGGQSFSGERTSRERRYSSCP